MWAMFASGFLSATAILLTGMILLARFFPPDKGQHELRKEGRG
jgi:hypothetical protein